MMSTNEKTETRLTEVSIPEELSLVPGGPGAVFPAMMLRSRLAPLAHRNSPPPLLPAVLDMMLLPMRMILPSCTYNPPPTTEAVLDRITLLLMAAVALTTHTPPPELAGPPAPVASPPVIRTPSIVGVMLPAM